MLDLEDFKKKKKKKKKTNMRSKDMSRVKLPAFIYDSPRTWWLTSDSIFSTYKIKNGTEKYNHLITNLPSDVTSKLLHMLHHDVEEAANVDSHLDMLKSALFQWYSPTEYQAYLNYDTLKHLQARMKPTVLCDSLRASLSAGIEVNTFYFRNKFLSLLPPSTRAQYLAAKLKDIDELAAFADEVSSTTANLVAAIKDTPDDNICATATTKIRQPPPSALTLPPDLMCFYHKRYGAQALRFKGGGCPKSPPSNKTLSGNAKRSGGSG